MSCQLIRFTVSEKRKLEKDNSWCITRKTAGLNKVVWLRIEQEGFEKETKALKLCDFCRDGTMYGSLWHSFIACWYLGLLLQSFSIAKFETSLLCGMLIDFVDNRLEVQRKYIKESPYLAWSMVNTKTHREIRKLLCYSFVLLWNLRFLQRCLWRYKYSEKWRRPDWYVFTVFSARLADSILSVQATDAFKTRCTLMMGQLHAFETVVNI